MTGIARWNELCMDTTGGAGLGLFWAGVLGLAFEPDDESGDVIGPTEGHGIAMCRVPESKTVKHRVHLDVWCNDVDDLVELGAEMVLPAAESGFPWTVLRDPEGGEFCAFVREDPPDYRLFQVVVDAVDAEASARWWADVFAGTPFPSDSLSWWRVRDIPRMPFRRLTFQQVPEPKQVKNRIHWDVYGHVDNFLERGATLLRRRGGDIRWDVMADPEGNEFCVFAPPATS